MSEDTKNKRQTDKGFSIGDEMYFIRDGMICHDKVSDIILFPENGGLGLNPNEVFRSKEELIEHLKKRVHG